MHVLGVGLAVQENICLHGRYARWMFIGHRGTQDSLLMMVECLGTAECWVVCLNHEIRDLLTTLLATTLPLKQISSCHTAAHGWLSVPHGTCMV